MVGWARPGRPESVLRDLDALHPIKSYDPEAKYIPPQWLFEGLTITGRVNGVFGNEKAGKSRFLNWLLAASLAGVESTVGIRVSSPGKVLYLLGEEQFGITSVRLRRYASLQGGIIDPASLSFMDPASGLRLERADYRDWLQEKLKGYDTVVIDPYRRVHSAEENSNTEMSHMHNSFRVWSNRDGKTIIIIHHSGHDTLDKIKVREMRKARIGDWSRGATELPTILDAAFYIQREDDIEYDRLTLFRDGRFPPLPPLMVRDLGGPDLNPENDNGFDGHHSSSALALPRLRRTLVSGHPGPLET